MIDANVGNALTNTVRAVLQSKAATEELELKVADLAALNLLQEMEARQEKLEERQLMQSQNNSRRVQ